MMINSALGLLLIFKKSVLYMINSCKLFLKRSKNI